MLYTLGKLSLSDTRFTRPKPLVLLSYLSLEGRQSRKHLAQLFWPDAKDAFGDLSVALSRLRKARPGSIESDTYSVKSALPTDALAFSRAAEQGQHKTALNLYQGPFLEDVALPDWSAGLESWVYDTRETLAAQAQTSLLKLAEHYAKESRAELAAQYAETAYTLPAAPAAEPETLTLIFDLLQEGGHEAARVVAAEAEELGLTLVKAAPSRAKFSEAVPHNLPSPKNAFIGRQEEIKRLSAQLSDPSCQLLTLMGPGGIGKSRLALNVAHTQVSQSRFKDGVYLASLESLTSSDLIPTRIAEALELSPKGRESHLDLIQSYIGKKQMLLVLDNMEHLLEDLSTVSALLASCPNLNLLVTSRARLDLEDEWVFRVGGLSCPPLKTEDDLLTYDAPKLFAERAKRARLDLALASDEYEDLARLCDLTGGSPLALEFAAAWLSTMSLSDVVRELEQSIEVLRATHPVRNERHQSMAGVFTQSWQRLAAEDQAALRKLSVFEGGFTREAALEVAGAGLEQLMRLISTSFVILEQSGRYGFHPLTKQYLREQLVGEDYREVERQHAEYFLALVEKAEPRLEDEKQIAWLNTLDDELNNLRAALRWSISQNEADIALHLVNALREFWLRRAYLKEGLEWLTQVLRLTDESDVFTKIKALEAAGLIAEKLSNLETARRYLEEGIKLDAALSLEERSIGLRRGLGDVMLSLGNYEIARAYYQEGIELSTRVGTLGETTKLLNCLGLLEEEQGHKRVAQTHYEKALSFAKELGEPHLTSMMLVNLALLHFNRGHTLKALELYQESLPLAKRLKNRRFIAAILNGLGAVEGALGNLSAARAYYEESLSVRKLLGIKSGIALTLGNLGNIDRRRGEYVLAEQYLQEGLRISQESGTVRTVLLNLEKYAELMRAVENFSLAVQIWSSVAQARQALGQPLPDKEIEIYRQSLSAAQKELGDEAFAANWKAGQKLTPEEIVEDVLD